MQTPVDNAPSNESARPASAAATPRDQWMFLSRRAPEAAAPRPSSSAAPKAPRTSRSCCEELERWDGLS